MAWEFAAIVKVRETGRDGLGNKNVKNILQKWILVSPGNNPNPPRIKFDFPKTKKFVANKGWESPVNKPYWAFTDDEVKRFKKAQAELGEQAIRTEGKVSVEGKSRKIHFESSDLLSLINEAGKEGWEITGGIGFANGGPSIPETRYRMMRREIQQPPLSQ